MTYFVGLLLSQDSNPDNKVAVVIIKPGQYFHNTGDLKNSYRELVEEIQNNGNKVLVVSLRKKSDISRIFNGMNRDLLSQFYNFLLFMITYCVIH